MTEAAGDAGAVDPPKLVHLDVVDTSVRFSLSFAIDQAGWSRVAAPSRHAALVADRVVAGDGRPPLDVLVLEPTPAASRRALEALLAGRVRSLVSVSDPSAVPAALESARSGLQVISDGVAEAALGYPALTERQERTLQLVVRGRSNRGIARELCHSEASTKRDLAALLRHFDASNRVELAATAMRLGLRADGRA